MEEYGCILVVEDDELIRESVREALEMEGYRVVTAANGHEALQVLESMGKPCLILLDLMMPVMNGWEFLERAASLKSTTLISLPIIVMSAASSDQLSETQGKVSGIIKKPFPLEHLTRVVSRYCAPPNQRLAG